MEFFIFIIFLFFTNSDWFHLASVKFKGILVVFIEGILF